MGNAAAVAHHGPGPYAVEALLLHASREGTLTLEHLAETLRCQIVGVSADGLVDSGAAEFVDPKRTSLQGRVRVDADKLYSVVATAVVRAAKDVPHGRVDPTDIYAYLTPIEARQGFPLALAALARNPRLAQQVMPGEGQRGSPWLPLHTVIVLGAKWQFWRRLALPLVDALLTANPRAAQRRISEGVHYPLGQLPLEACVVRGWDAALVERVHRAWSPAATTLDPNLVKFPSSKKTKAQASGSGAVAKGDKALISLLNMEIIELPLPGGVGAVACVKGLTDAARPENTRGLRWLRKTAEVCRPRPPLDVMLLLPKPADDLKSWTSGKDLRVAAEDKTSKKAIKLARQQAKQAAKLEARAAKALSRKPTAELARPAVSALLEAAVLLSTAAAALEAQHADHRFVLLADVDLHGAICLRRDAALAAADAASPPAKAPRRGAPPAQPGDAARRFAAPTTSEDSLEVAHEHQTAAERPSSTSSPRPTHDATRAR
ncbi:hypothetical protein M885DRAFT_625853 [Pelagophyceae sp. CCMP2097]|nr:hypothetical protein M885DRAFT_625853 [Pelagophyceae sp. CCMP2097]|mmetsp:Transcript_32165/g.111165  ORF Transcript_32165/g.111165 Transcript_32165/m.111165 type:complete len:491 (-) Transcript_32165:57-1529(-)